MGDGAHGRAPCSVLRRAQVVGTGCWVVRDVMPPPSAPDPLRVVGLESPVTTPRVVTRGPRVHPGPAGRALRTPPTSRDVRRAPSSGPMPRRLPLVTVEHHAGAAQRAAAGGAGSRNTRPKWSIRCSAVGFVAFAGLSSTAAIDAGATRTHPTSHRTWAGLRADRWAARCPTPSAAGHRWPVFPVDGHPRWRAVVQRLRRRCPAPRCAGRGLHRRRPPPGAGGGGGGSGDGGPAARTLFCSDSRGFGAGELAFNVRAVRRRRSSWAGTCSRGGCG